MATKQKRLHHFIVIEVITFFTLQGGDDDQLNIAEQIAANHYYYIDDIIDTVKIYANTRKFSKELKEVKAIEGFKKFWRPVEQAVAKKPKFTKWEKHYNC